MAAALRLTCPMVLHLFRPGAGSPYSLLQTCIRLFIKGCLINKSKCTVLCFNTDRESGYYCEPSQPSLNGRALSTYCDERKVPALRLPLKPSSDARADMPRAMSGLADKKELSTTVPKSHAATGTLPAIAATLFTTTPSSLTTKADIWSRLSGLYPVLDPDMVFPVTFHCRWTIQSISRATLSHQSCFVTAIQVLETTVNKCNSMQKRPLWTHKLVISDHAQSHLCAWPANIYTSWCLAQWTRVFYVRVVRKPSLMCLHYKWQ